jgi:hypothetical protein
MSGIDCSFTSADKATAAADVARSVISTICNRVPGLNCIRGDKVVITKLCGQAVENEVGYSPLSRRKLSSVSQNDVVEYTIILNAIADSDLRQKDSLLGQYLQGTSLDNILAEILTEVTSSSDSQTTQSISAIYYEFVNSFIEGLGLYYPAWGNMETCLSDGNQPDYMNNHPDIWMFTSLEDCCNHHYSWDYTGCMQTNAQATLVSSSGIGTGFADPTLGLYFPDWGRTNTCINDGSAPPYMKKDSKIWMTESLQDCCKTYYSWEDEYIACMSSEGGSMPTQSPAEGWYVQWKTYTCVKNCEGPSPCGGIAERWDIIQSSKEECCKEHLVWKENCLMS